VKFCNYSIEPILKKFGNNDLFAYESNMAGRQSLHDSDIMISDWSGAALDYAFGLNKPVLFVDIQRKVNNQDYEDLDIEPFEVFIRNKIGMVIDPGNILFQMDEQLQTDTRHRQKHVFNPERSGAVGAKYVLNILNR